MNKFTLNCKCGAAAEFVFTDISSAAFELSKIWLRTHELCIKENTYLPLPKGWEVISIDELDGSTEFRVRYTK